LHGKLYERKVAEPFKKKKKKINKKKKKKKNTTDH